MLSETDSETQFDIYARRMAGCLANLDLLPEPDIADALESLSIIRESKAKTRLYFSPLFGTLTRMALDPKREIPVAIQKALVFLISCLSARSRSWEACRKTCRIGDI